MKTRSIPTALETFLERSKLCLEKTVILLNLAWNLLCNKCASIIAFLKQILHSPDFIEKHRNSPTAFTRNRKLPFHLLVCFLINFVKGAYQTELDRFFQAITRSSIAKRIVSKAAFAKARMKLKFEVFVELNHYLIDKFNSLFPCRTWHDFRLLVIDGTTLTLPKTKQISEYFGVWRPRQGEPCPKARASQLYDPLNKLTINAIITPKNIGEREHAIRLLSHHLPSKSLILLDRGYPAFWLFKLILFNKAEFCARISKKWNVVRRFIRSGKKEKIIEIKPSVTSIKYCRKLGLDEMPIKLRLVRIELNSGEVEVLITSLIDRKSYPHGIFYELYHNRWPVEEDYKIIKRRIEMEAFTGQSVLSIYQDFHANIFAKNLVSVLTFSIQTSLKTKGVKVKYTHQVNFTQALSKAKYMLSLLFQRTNRTVKKLIHDFMEIVANTTEPIRLGRQYPRNFRISKKHYYQNYKAIC